MRVLLALGGNAMTNADGRARPEDQIAAAEVAMEAVADLLAAGRRRRDHPRQRAPGRQPAGQERDRGGRRTPGAAGLVRRADPGDPRVRADGRARRRAGPARHRPPLRRPWSPAPSSTPTTRASARPTKPIGRFLPRRRGRAARRARRDLGGPRREGLAAGGRLAGAAARSSTPRPCWHWSTPGSSWSPTAAAGSRSSRDAGRLPARRRGGHRQGPRRRPARRARSTPTCS